MRNEELRAMALAIAMICVLAACTSAESAEGISVPLSGTGSGGSVYVLRAARFRIVGPRTMTLSGDETMGTTISAGLPVGDYTVQLLDGWSLVRLPDGTPMIATLASANPQMVSVTPGMRVRVTFVFDVQGEMVSMTGDGDIDIAFEVREDAGGPPECMEGQMEPCGCGGDRVCMGGIWQACSAPPPGPEICNAFDDDCDGVVDEGVPACGIDAGAPIECMEGDMRPCESMPGCMGHQQCVGGLWGDCMGTGSAEVCNALDDDCDGVIDEGNPEGGLGCGPTIGECSPGTTACIAGTVQCTGAIGPTAEICNALDDDCDGVVDEGDLGGGMPCGSDVGACVTGMLTCAGGALVCTGAVGPAPETCNAIDDDCDGATDEGLGC